MEFLKSALAAGLILAVLDALWLGVIARDWLASQSLAITPSHSASSTARIRPAAKALFKNSIASSCNSPSYAREWKWMCPAPVTAAATPGPGHCVNHLHPLPKIPRATCET